MRVKAPDETMSARAQILNEAVIVDDLEMAKSAIRDCPSKLQVASLMLEATHHCDRTADDGDWCWLLEHLG